MKSNCLQSAASRFLSALGRTVGRNPYYFVIFPIIVSLSLSYGLFKVKVNRNINELFTSFNGRAAEEKRILRGLFPKGSSTIARQASIDEVAIIQAVARDGGTIFRKSIFEDLIVLDKIITEFNVTWNNIPLNYSMICSGKCQVNNVLELYDYLTEEGLERRRVKYPVEFNKVTFTMKEYVFSLGGVETDDDGYITDGKAIRLVYILDRANHSKSESIRLWVRSLNKFIQSIKFDNIRYTLFNYETAEDELITMSGIASTDIPIVVCALGMFAFLSCMTDNLIGSKPLLGLSSCVSAILAIVSGFGACILVDVPFTDFQLFTGFVILAIEVDDAFILIAAWRKTNPADNVPKRMQETFSTTAVSITITSATNIISYLIGIYTSFPVIMYACIYCAVTSLFSYVYLLTFFGGCLALDGYREEKRKNPVFLCVEGRKDLSSVRWNEQNKEEFFMRNFRDFIGKALSFPLVQVTIILLFLVDLIIGVWGLKFLVCGNSYTDLLNDESELREIEKGVFKYFYLYSSPIHVIIERPLNYADPSTQNSIDELMRRLEAHPHIADESLRLSWLKYYNAFASSAAAPLLLRGYNISRKEDFIEGLRNVFLNMGRAKEFQEDIVFNENFTDIIACRFLIPTKAVTSPSIELLVKNYVYSVVDQSTLPVRVFSPLFHFLEQAELIKSIMLTTAAVASTLILFMFFLFIPNAICSLCIFAIVVCMFCETLGYMSLWDVKLDLCSLTALISCIGFSINYPTHISFSFANPKNMSSEDRLKHALYDVGVPIVQGSVSTILGIITLAFADYYAIRSIFKVVFLITIQTAVHSLFSLLVLLTALGRCSKSLSIGKESPNSGASTNMLKTKVEVSDFEES